MEKIIDEDIDWPVKNEGKKAHALSSTQQLKGAKEIVRS